MEIRGGLVTSERSFGVEDIVGGMPFGLVILPRRQWCESGGLEGGQDGRT